MGHFYLQFEGNNEQLQGRAGWKFGLGSDISILRTNFFFEYTLFF